MILGKDTYFKRTRIARGEFRRIRSGARFVISHADEKKFTHGIEASANKRQIAVIDLLCGADRDFDQRPRCERCADRGACR
jgi:hypothetical protein